MSSPLQSLIATGTKLWLDSVDPGLVKTNRALGATGATSNPIIISDLIKTGRFDSQLPRLFADKSVATDEAAWVTGAQPPVDGGGAAGKRDTKRQTIPILYRAAGRRPISPIG